VNSKPSLLIYADDVNCGHGATAGHMDESALFYLRSRGLDVETASRMLVHAFASEIIETVKLKPLRDYLDGLFRRAVPTTSLRLGGEL
jgi:Fe-S cluster assembly protein SufD